MMCHLGDVASFTRLWHRSGGGITIPPRQFLLVCLLAAPDGKNNAAICVVVADVGVGGEADLHGAEWRESKCCKLFMASSFVFSYLALSL